MRLLRADAELRLRPQARRVLRVLLLHRCPHDWLRHMMAEAWEGTFVSRHTVSAAPWPSFADACLSSDAGSPTDEGSYALDVPSSESDPPGGISGAVEARGAERAVECFQKAADECPGYFRLYEGLSTCYLCLPRSYACAARGLSEVSRGARTGRGPGGMTGELIANRGQGLHLFERNVVEAEAELLVAQRS